MEDPQSTEKVKTFSSPARIQTGPVYLIGIQGTLTLTQEMHLVFQARNGDQASGFDIPLIQLKTADFSNAMAGRASFTDASGKTYRIIFVKWSPLQLIISFGAVGSGLTVTRAFEWQSALAPLVGPQVLIHSNMKQ